MKGINFKKAFCVGGILLLSVFVAIQSSWACDDDDKWDRDWHDKWRWDHRCSTCNPPKIEIVYVDYFANSIELNIWGKNFDSGIRPVVTLGGLYELNVDDDYSDTHITATLPLQNLNGNFVYGDYRLVVSTCHDSACKYCKDYCSKCKDKRCRDYCSKCKDRYCKNKYCKDCGNKCRCKDRYSLTIANPEVQKGEPGPAGPPAPPGPPGTFVTVIVTATENEFNEVATGIFSGIASCAKAGEGYSVTGGGFSAGKDGIVLESKPKSLPDGSGWELVITGGPPDTRQPPPGVTVWAVCGKVQ